MWYYDKNQKVDVYIFDSHRPFNHFNIIDPLKKIRIIDDGCDSFNQCPSLEDIHFLQANQDDGDEDDDSDDEDCSDDDIDEEEVKEELEDLKDS